MPNDLARCYRCRTSAGKPQVACWSQILSVKHRAVKSFNSCSQLNKTLQMSRERQISNLLLNHLVQKQQCCSGFYRGTSYKHVAVTKNPSRHRADLYVHLCIASSTDLRSDEEPQMLLCPVTDRRAQTGARRAIP